MIEQLNWTERNLVLIGACWIFTCSMQTLKSQHVRTEFLRSWFPSQGSNPGPLHWEHRVLATGPLGKPPHRTFTTSWSTHPTCRPLPIPKSKMLTLTSRHQGLMTGVLAWLLQCYPSVRQWACHGRNLTPAYLDVAGNSTAIADLVFGTFYCLIKTLAVSLQQTVSPQQTL